MRFRQWFVFLFFLATLAAVPSPAGANGIADWNDTAISVARASADPVLLRTVAMVHIAMFDAVNAVDPKFQEYAVRVDGSGASPEAAAAAAAYGILVRRFPAQKPTLDAAFAASLATIADGSPKEWGKALGDSVAAAVYALRANDGMNPPVNPPYVPGTGPGEYQLTAPIVVNSGAATYQPFSMKSASQFRPEPPPPLTSKRYARDVEETARLGTANPAMRTPEMDLIARWQIEMAQFQLFRIARTAINAANFPLLKSARMFALMSIALNDAFIGVFEAKYHYRFWRPVTAIRNAESDGNRWTVSDPSWTPFLPVPPHPEYPAAHTMISAAGITVMEHFLGRQFGFTTTEDVPDIPGVQSRTFESLDAMLEDMGMARIYGGMHFRTSVETGAKQGRKVGRWVLEHELRRRPD